VMMMFVDDVVFMLLLFFVYIYVFILQLRMHACCVSHTSYIMIMCVFGQTS